MAAASSWQQYLPPSCPASPNLTEERIDIVRKTWLTLKSGQGKGERDRLGSNPSVQDAMDLLAVMFFEILFKNAPEVEALFQCDLVMQGRRLTTALNNLVDLLGKDAAAISEILTRLAEVHHPHGIQPEHYDPFGQALLAMVKAGLAEDFTSDVCEAWEHLYSTICSFMIPVTQKLTRSR
ncbi:Globin domain-containing protein [Plasmodiophora brassicae]|uniref:Globin domain-containing protein n=1 Tax=Plasmodiophora brassicae TaxID=37360 RepID=A0A0G4II14_PLABS|nr:hypothetical protein PBRA_003666 [Plasmodiophora brassicae]SPQ94186.1 unnamed protein product [Plasmodiophora brassicae]